jgi:hypothetical protein
MPLSSEQRRKLDICIRSNTIYEFQVVGTNSLSGRSYIINIIEQALDAAVSLRCDLFLPNCFINGCQNSIFWYKIAAIVCCKSGVNDWHELEYGPALSRCDPRQRYVYTWTLKGDTYRFYTKKLCDGCYPELVWYIGKSVNITSDSAGGNHYVHEEQDAMDSSDDTDSEDITSRT